MRGELQPGQAIGRCTIRQRVGVGSMGIVYEAHHNTLDIDVAVKVLHEHAVGPDGAEWKERLRREAQIAARLNHPGLVRVLDYGEDWGSPYIVMEFVRGQTLEQFLSDRVLLDENLALRILGQVATGLHAAHQAGIVHRDIKPANLLIGRDGQKRMQQELERRAGSSSGSGTGTRFGRALRGKLRVESESGSGIKVVHATVRERLVAWIFLLALALAVFEGLGGFHRQKEAAGRDAEVAPRPEAQTGR